MPLPFMKWPMMQSKKGYRVIYVGSQYIQHNPAVGDGLGAFIGYNTLKR